MVIFHPLHLKKVWALVIFSVVILRPEPEDIASEGRLLLLFEFLTFAKVIAEAPTEVRDHREGVVSPTLNGLVTIVWEEILSMAFRLMERLLFLRVFIMVRHVIIMS